MNATKSALQFEVEFGITYRCSQYLVSTLYDDEIRYRNGLAVFLVSIWEVMKEEIILWL